MDIRIAFWELVFCATGMILCKYGVFFRREDREGEGGGRVRGFFNSLKFSFYPA